jgi:hypothetical protein
MNSEFENIIKTIDYDHYCDTERFYKDVTQTPYTVIAKDGFGILIEYYIKFGKKIGYSRGGIRFDRNTKTIDELNDFIKYLKKELKSNDFMFLGMEHVEEENDFTKLFDKENYRIYLEGSAFIYPKENWTGKFNSKKRYDLTYGLKKGVNVRFFSNVPEVQSLLNTNESVDFDNLYKLVESTLKRHGHKYDFPSKDVLTRYLKELNYILSIAEFEGKWLAYNLSFYNINGTRVERVYAGASEEGLRLRAPSAIEVSYIDILYKLGIKTYDLWGIKQGKGYSAFKESIADELKNYAKFSIIKIDRPLADLTLFLIKLKSWLNPN